MLNYMKSEIYRIVRDKRLWILLLAFSLLLAAVVAVLAFFQNYEVNFPYGNTKFALSNIYASLTMLMFVAGGFILLLNDGDKTHVYKNSIAFGVKRSTVLLGKFLVQAVTAIMSCLLLAALYSLLCSSFLVHSDVGEFVVYWKAILSASLGLLSALAGVYMFVMIADTMSFAMISSVVIMMAVPVIFSLFGRRIGVFKVVSKLFPYIALGDYSSHTLTFEVTGIDTMLALLTGGCWLAGFLAYGLVMFNKKEIK